VLVLKGRKQASNGCMVFDHGPPCTLEHQAWRLSPMVLHSLTTVELLCVSLFSFIKWKIFDTSYGEIK
jgi:hypothetical protein